MMELSHLLEPARCLTDLRYGDKAACLGDLAKRAAVALGLDRPAIVEALLHREGLGSTGLGNGIALPHARLPGLAAPYVLLARLREPIAFEAIDGQPVDLVCLVLTPADSDAAARTSLACVARRLRDPQVLGAIRKARTGAALYAAAAGTVA